MDKLNSVWRVIGGIIFIVIPLMFLLHIVEAGPVDAIRVFVMAPWLAWPWLIISGVVMYRFFEERQ